MRRTLYHVHFVYLTNKRQARTRSRQVQHLTRVKLEKTKSTKFAYIEHVGAYDKIPFGAYIEQLYGWTKQNHVRPGFYPMGIFPNDPENMAAETCKSHIGIPIYGNAKPGGRIGIKQLAPMNVASISHKGPSEGFPKTYRNLSDWIINHGYAWAGPSIEIYTRKPKTVQGETILYAKIEAPVRKLVSCGKERRTRKLAS
ncbi:MAG TPA: GyrI-like domain-containing protein [Candidatus Bathyarchaeia archaeon]|nr:GyrI-like domain-containing protein [Candidatus Bathyarchaeia archaeon]